LFSFFSSLIFSPPPPSSISNNPPSPPLLIQSSLPRLLSIPLKCLAYLRERHRLFSL
jgi:hypothetical protein